MKAADVMVANVITVGPDARVEDVAGVLLTNRISAVPVVDDDGRMIGIISEGDLGIAPCGTSPGFSDWVSPALSRF